MATRDIKTKLSLEGEAEYKKQLKEINSGLKVLSSEMQLVTEKYKGQANGVAALSAKNDVLNRQILSQKEKVETLKKALQESAQTYGESDERTKKWQVSLNNAERDLLKLDDELKQNDKYLDEAKQSADGCAKSIDKYGKEVKQAATEQEGANKKTSMFADIFKGGTLAGLATQAISAITNKIKELAQAAMESADELMKLSDQTGISTDELQKLQYIGDDVGVSLDTITGAQSKLTKAMGNAQSGTAETIDAFNELDVAYKNSDGSLRNRQEVFADVIDALGHMTNETQRDVYAQILLGKSAMELNPMIKLGADAIREMGDEAERTGAIMSENTVQTLDTVGDTLDHVGQSAKATIGNIMYDFLNVGGVWDKVYAAQETATEKTIPAVQDMEAAIASLNEEYAAAKDTIEATLDALIGGWEAAPEVVATSAEEVIANLQSQLDYLDDYRANMDALMSRKIPGVDMSVLIESLSDGSAESAAILAGLATATDEEIAQISQSLGNVESGKEAFSSAMAATQTDYDKRMADIVGTTVDAVKKMDLSDEAKTSALNTINGYINGVRAQSGALNLAMTVAAQNALNAWKRQFDEHSPSREMIKSGKNAIQGAIIGVEEKQGDLVSLYTATGKNLLDGLAIGMKNGSDKVMETTDDIASELARRVGDITSAFSTSSDIEEIKYKLWEVKNGSTATGKETKAKKKETLKNQIGIQEDTISAVNDAYKKMAELTGKNSEESRKLEKQLLTEQLALEKLKNEYKEVSKTKSATYDKKNLAKLAEDEFKLWSLQNDNASASEKLAAQSGLLALKYDMQGKSIEETKAALEDATKQYGLNSEESQKLQEQLLNEKILYEEIRVRIDEVKTAMQHLGTSGASNFAFPTASEIWCGMQMPERNSNKVIADAVNAITTMPQAPIVIQNPLYINGKELARATVSDFRAVEASSPQVRSDKL